MISVSSLSYTYPGNSEAALTDISFSVAEGEVCAILGPSGSGKTTLLRCIAGLLPTQAGKISTGANSAQAWHQQCALIFQDHALVPRQNVLWHVCCGALAHYRGLRSLLPWRKSDLEQASKLIQDVGLNGREFDAIHALSGGQKQRVAIARALMQNPRFILADEPIASLDPGVAKNILALLKEIIGDTYACLCSLHQVAVARSFADRIIALNNGRLIYDGPSDEFTADVETSVYTKPTEIAS